MKPWSVSWVGLVAFVGAAALSGCDYFTNVVIPATDTTPPLAVSGFYDLSQANYVALGLGEDAIQYTVTDQTIAYELVGATYDEDGGAKSVHISGDIYYECEDGTAISVRHFDKDAGQTGKPGDTVSNGVWTGVTVRFADMPPKACEQNGYGKTVDKLAQLLVTSEDFGGNLGWGWAEVRTSGP